MTEPNTLYHWSEDCLDVFTPGHFKVSTQGRVYTVDRFEAKAGTTKQVKAKSLLVFAGEAKELFERHSYFTTAIFKPILGQWWTRRIGDVMWDAADTSSFGNVMVVTRARIVPLRRWSWRWWWQYSKIATTRLFDLTISTVFALYGGAAVWVHHGWPYAADVRFWFSAPVGAVASGIGPEISAILESAFASPPLLSGTVLGLILALFVVLLRAGVKSRPPGIEQDLMAAIQAAIQTELLPPGFAPVDGPSFLRRCWNRLPWTS